MNRTTIYLMITLTIMFICSSCTSSLLENDLKKAELKGKVKNIKTVKYKAVEKFGELEKDKSGETSIRIYNQEGNMIERNEYYSNGSLNYKFKCTYDEKGNITDESYENKSYSSKAKYTYDKNGNLIEKSAYDANGDIKGRAKYNYDKNGNMTESSLYGSEGNEKTKYSYDKNGNKIEENYYDENGNLNGRLKYNYDQNGKVVELSDYGPKGLLSCTTKYSYDENGNMTEEYTDYGYNELIGEHSYIYSRYTYDKKGNKIEYSIKIEGREEGKLSYDIKGNLIAESICGSDFHCDHYSKEIKYIYDKKGNMIEKNESGYFEYIYDKKGNMIEKNESGYFGEDYWEKTTYSYDKKGNWIQRIRYYSNSGRHSNQRCEITEREIEYY